MEGKTLDMPSCKSIQNEKGFTLIEMVVAAVLLVITSLSLGYFMKSGITLRGRTLDIDIASRLAQNEAERIKAAGEALVRIGDTSYEHESRGRTFLVERKEVTLDLYTQGSSFIYEDASEFSIEIIKMPADTPFLNFRVLYK